MYLLDCHRNQRVCLKRQLAGKHLEHHHAQRIDVAAGIGEGAAGLLGTDVVHRADGFVGDGLGGAAGKAGNAKISDFDGPVRQQHDIVRLDVAVDNALVVRVLQRPQNLHGKVDCFLPAQHLFLVDVVLQGDAVDVFHHNRLDAVGEDDVIHLDDIRVIQQRDGAGLVAETAHKFVVVHIFFPQNLDRHRPRFHHVIRLVDVCHSAHADQLAYLIASIQFLSNVFIHSE